VPTVPGTKPRKPRHDQRRLPEHVPRETRDHPKGHPSDAPCACSECGGKLRQIGEDVAEQLEYVPGHFKVIRHVRPKAGVRALPGHLPGAGAKPTD